MARPRIFVSSTYYDLKHIRASLDVFIETMGFESILSEKGDIAYSPDIPLDASCYKEVSTADILVIVIGGRYGSPASHDRTKSSSEFLDRYDSITKMELQEALRRDIPIYILIESPVFSEYQTFLRNKGNKDIRYAHVDSINIFELIESIILRPKNNPVKTFDRFAEIEAWLRDQWSGLFRELLSRMAAQKEIVTLNEQVKELRDVNATLKSYLESILQGVTSGEKAEKIIEKEDERLNSNKIRRAIEANRFVDYLRRHGVDDIDQIIAAIKNAKSFDDLFSLLDPAINEEKDKRYVGRTIRDNQAAQQDANAVRRIYDLSDLPLSSLPDDAPDVSEVAPRASRSRRKSGAS